MDSITAILRRLFTRRKVQASSESMEFFLGSGNRSSSGMAVNEKTAMNVGAVYASVALIAGAIASLPLPIFKRTAGGRERVDHPHWLLLNVNPHPVWSAAMFWEFMITSLLLHGDAFARILRRNGKIAGLQPIAPRDVEVKLFEEGPLDDFPELLYLVNKDGGTIRIPQADVLHIPGLGFDGLRGLSPIRHAAKQAIGIALAADESAARFFGNGMRPDFILSTAGGMDEEHIEVLRRKWAERYGGASNSHMPAILTGGLKAEPLTLPARDMEIIATRQFEVEDIARIYGVPPFMIGQTEKTTSFGSGVEQMSIGFVKYTLQRHLVKIEQEINRKFFPSDNGKLNPNFAEFSTAGLERGDLKTRYDAFRIALGRAGEPGFFTVNEVRRMENMPPLEGGDELNLEKPNEPTDQAAAG